MRIERSPLEHQNTCLGTATIEKARQEEGARESAPDQDELVGLIAHGPPLPPKDASSNETDALLDPLPNGSLCSMTETDQCIKLQMTRCNVVGLRAYHEVD
jgi:hypothetical protein